MSLLKPTRFKYLQRFLPHGNPVILDVGAGSQSGSITKRWFPKATYHGIDRTRKYQNEEHDIAVMDRFIEMDVTALDFSVLEDEYYDVIIMSHIIEHLPNAESVIEGLLPKVKRNGLLYIEYPSSKSTSFPSMKGTLNFYDDPTHCRLFERTEIESLLQSNSCQIEYSGIRRDWVRIMMMPVLALHAIKKYGYVAGSVFWDLFGFAEIVIARKS